jgi:hypothetical protein
VDTSRLARDELISGNMKVDVANAIAHNNGRIVGAHALELRKRMFEAEMAGFAGKIENRSGERLDGEEKSDSARVEKTKKIKADQQAA